MKKYIIKAFTKGNFFIKEIEETNISYAIQRFSAENKIHLCDIFSAVEVDDNYDGTCEK